MLKRILVLFIFISYFLLLTAQAAEIDKRYQYLISDIYGSYYIDTFTVKHRPKNHRIDSFIKDPMAVMVDNGYVDVWVRVQFTEQGVKNQISSRRGEKLSVDRYEKLSYSLKHIYVDFSKGEYLLLESTDYDINHKVLSYTFPDDSRKLAKVKPGSLDEDFINKLARYMVSYYTDMQQRQNEFQKQELQMLTAPANRTNQFMLVMSDDKRTRAFDVYSVKFVKQDPNIVEVRTRTRYSKAGIEDLINSRQSNRLSTAGFEAIDTTYLRYWFDLKQKRFMLIGAAYIDKSGKIFESVAYLEENREWFSPKPESPQEKILDAVTNWVNSNYDLVKNRS